MHDVVVAAVVVDIVVVVIYLFRNRFDLKIYTKDLVFGILVLFLF